MSFTLNAPFVVGRLFFGARVDVSFSFASKAIIGTGQIMVGNLSFMDP